MQAAGKRRNKEIRGILTPVYSPPHSGSMFAWLIIVFFIATLANCLHAHYILLHVPWKLGPSFQPHFLIIIRIETFMFPGLLHVLISLFCWQYVT